MAATIYAAADVAGVVLRVTRCRVNRDDAASSLAGGAKQSAPGMGPRTGFLKTPSLVDSVFNRLADLFVRMARNTRHDGGRKTFYSDSRKLSSSRWWRPPKLPPVMMSTTSPGCTCFSNTENLGTCARCRRARSLFPSRSVHARRHSGKRNSAISRMRSSASFVHSILIHPTER